MFTLVYGQHAVSKSWETAIINLLTRFWKLLSIHKSKQHGYKTGKLHAIACKLQLVIVLHCPVLDIILHCPRTISNAGQCRIMQRRAVQDNIQRCTALHWILSCTALCVGYCRALDIILHCPVLDIVLHCLCWILSCTACVGYCLCWILVVLHCLCEIFRVSWPLFYCFCSYLALWEKKLLSYTLMFITYLQLNYELRLLHKF